MAGSSQGDRSGLGIFAAELAAARAAAGLTQEELASRVTFSASAISMVEQRRRVPSADLARRCDEALGLPGTLRRLQQHAQAAPLPAWFRPYAEVEAAATVLRSWQPMVIDGLAQTEDYARALLAEQPGTSEDQLEDRTAARISRQAILARPESPVVTMIMDEAVLIRPVGGVKVMHGQLVHLEQLARQPDVTVLIVPLSTGAHCGLLGAFAVAETQTGRTGFMESPDEGLIVEHPPAVSRLVRALDILASEALPRAASRDLILRRADDHDS
jgi:transcriptional regulator with XRE-family HTH domain